ncbi:hypothetical protein J3R30DRAFT_3300245 [Lentinula aciculospora]|uniref:NAD-dependent epimerase/dehydratase domain-containing protein n=1 Tax=Lentinula aciculospora TaxID=153920 RepID=A0A9W9A0K7_9AGAR|nr:hypothetical protein J3R30DRAFT_3300245 [Lentinula aciculospora]
MSATNVVVVTGAGGFLASLVARALLEDTLTPNIRLILTDVIQPKNPAAGGATDPEHVLTIKADLTDPKEIDALFNTPFGIPDTVYCMHGIMSRGSEDNFDFGLKVNADSVRDLLQASRRYGTQLGKPIRFVFTSSCAVYGGPLPHMITPETIATPEGAYGLAKLSSELFINEFSRRGLIDGRILRLPTIVVRPGPPAAAASSFLSGIIREPLKGVEATCPMGTSISSPELDLPVWLSSPQTVIRNLIHAKHIPSSAFPSHTRVVCAPGFTATVRHEIDALRQVGGEEALKLIKFEDDPPTKRLVDSWPQRFDNTYALSLGFTIDEGGMIPIVDRFKKDVEAGIA